MPDMLDEFDAPTLIRRQPRPPSWERGLILVFVVIVGCALTATTIWSLIEQ